MGARRQQGRFVFTVAKSPEFSTVDRDQDGAKRTLLVAAVQDQSGSVVGRGFGWLEWRAR
jgi:hypothetical protein